MGNGNEIVIAVPVVDQHANASTSLIQRGVDMLHIGVTDTESHAEALIIVRDAKACKKKMMAAFKEPCDLAHRTWKSFTELRSKFTNPLTAMIERVDKAANAYAYKETLRSERVAKEQADKLRRQQIAEAEVTAAQTEDPVEAEEILADAETAPPPDGWA